MFTCGELLLANQCTSRTVRQRLGATPSVSQHTHACTSPSKLFLTKLFLPRTLCDSQVAVGVMLKSLTEGAGSHAMAIALVALVCIYVAGFAWSW